MAPRPWRSKPSPRVDPTRANGEHEACARAPDGAGGGGRAYRRAYRRMKGTRAGALWTHSDACVGRSPHNIHDPGCITGSAVSSARRMFRWSRVRQVFRCAHRTEFAHWTSHSGGTMRRDATRPQAAGPARTRNCQRFRDARSDAPVKRTGATPVAKVRGRVRGARGVRSRGDAAWSASRARALRASIRETRAPSARPPLAGRRVSGRCRPGCTLPRALASRVTRVRTWCLPPPARRDPRPLNRFERKRRDARRRPRRRGPERPRGGARNGAASSVHRTRAGRARRAAPRVRPRVALKNSCGCRRRGPGAGAGRGAHRERDRGPGREDARLSNR